MIYGHSGTNSGGSSMLLWCPAKNVAIATITNVPTQGYPLADRLFDTVFPEVFGIEKPKTPEPDSLSRKEFDSTRFVGTFEAWGNRMVFSDEDEALVVRAYQGSSSRPSITSELLSLEGDRFLPANSAMSGNRGWDVAFWGDDGSGRATHFLNGVFAMRRVE